ncbi:MAG: glycoside hydrolase family 2 TIM barrel-domain containing protein [Alistipes sp.]|nr:glycoside hydrolase family 2 TIM barrel-domain containing protein [Alistipes sp.]
MRRIILILAIFYCGTLFSQSYIEEVRPFVNREAARAWFVPQHKSTLEDGEENRYLRGVEWSQDESDKLVYRASCNIPFAWANRQILLRVKSAPQPFALYVGDRFAGRVQTGATPSEFNLTKLLKEGRNELTIKLEPNMEYATFEDFVHPSNVGESMLISQPTIRIREVLAVTKEIASKNLSEVAIVVKSDALNRKSARIYYELLSPSGVRVKMGHQDISLSMRGEDTLRFTANIEQDSLWSIDSALYYTLRLRTQTMSRFTEYINLKVAFRTLEYSDFGLKINGKQELLKGYVVDKELNAEELHAIKDRGYNLLYPLPGYSTEELYSMADTIGLYVVAQAPLCSEKSGMERTKGGNPSNKPELRLCAAERAEAAYHTSKHHPSVVAYSIAHNSSNGICLYESYLGMKRLEPTVPIIYLGADGEWNSDKLAIIW